MGCVAAIGAFGILLLGVPHPASAQAAGPLAAGTVSAGALSFDGHATAGDFTGTTSAVTGEMSAADSLAGVRGWVEAPVRTLVTGNSRRDRDLNKSMESDKYPALRFDLTGVAPAPAGGADSGAVTLRGKMTLHGVTREVELPARVSRSGAGLEVRSDFPLDLTDYRIGGLTKMLGMLRMHERIEVHVALTFAPRPP
jgi:polyisoprenoid-binding protein YceI